MQTRNPDWRIIVLAIVSSLGAIAVFGFAALSAVIGLLPPTWLASTTNARPFDSTVMAYTLILIGIAFIPAAYFSIRRLLGKDIPAAAIEPMNPWFFILIAAAWGASAWLAQALFNHSATEWISPVFYLFATALPAYFLLRLAMGGLPFGSRLRGWSTLSTGMALGASVSILAEAAIAIIALIGVGVYLGLNPAQMITFKHLADQINSGGNLDNLAAEIAPLLTNPLAILTGVLFFSVLTPLIEETSKSLTVWLLFDRLELPVQGFVAGALSGTGFGLLESLFASASPDSSWASTLLVRGASTMMHILAASLTGWGIASYRRNKKPLHLIGTYLLAMTLHGLWNGCVVMIVVGGMSMINQAATATLLGTALIAFGGSVLAILGLSLPVAIGVINWRMRKSIPPATPIATTSAANQAGVQ